MHSNKLYKQTIISLPLVGGMINELLWIMFMLLTLSTVLFAYRFFGRTGLYCMIVINIIVANLQVVKTVELFGLVATLGNILYGSVFLATDILNENYGKTTARKGVWFGFIAFILMVVFMQIGLWFIPHESDFAHPFMQGLFGIMPRILVGSLIAYLISQHHDVWAFNFWKKKTKGKYLWLRNNLSTIVSQLIDSIVFCVIAFLGVWEMNIWWQILLTTYIFKLIVAVADTPFLYIARLFKKKVDDLESKQ